jgi:hypothetical protein
MRTPIPALVLACLATALLAGCAGAPGGNLTYNGASNGTQQTTFQCDGSGKASFSANLGSGQVSVTAKDPTGKVAYINKAVAPGQNADSGDVVGVKGTWELTATRSGTMYGPFSGQYAFHVEC